MSRGLVLWITLVCLVIAEPFHARAEDRELLLGAIYKESAWAVPQLVGKPPRFTPPVDILKGSLKVEVGDLYTLKRYQFNQYVTDNQPYRWRIVRDIFWGGGTAGVRHFGLSIMCIPRDDLVFVDPMNAKHREQYLAKYPDDEIYKRGGTPHALLWEVGPVQTVCYHHPLGPGDVMQPPNLKAPIPAPGVFFDIYPVADDRLLLFVIDGDYLRVWSGTRKRRNDWMYFDMDWGKDDRDIERFRSPLKKAFTAFVRDNKYYFVTEHGDMYLARPVREGERKMEKIWDGHRQPIHALITDASNDKVYCFVEPFFTDKQDEERVYFELADKPEPARYSLKRIEGGKIPEPLKSVLEYAHVLQEDNRIK